MPLIRVFTRMDTSHKITLSRGIRKALEIKPGDKLELTIGGMKKARKLFISKKAGRV